MQRHVSGEKQAVLILSVTVMLKQDGSATICEQAAYSLSMH